uniref:Reverse transcriptase domain-containing protein n=1 Tax=Chenopodium quinoa TaxID=63459 RepID=A0A803L7J8_CHEQI
MLKESNMTYITLIPKSKHPKKVDEFRPISICNSLYKVIPLCMVNRLKSSLPDLISEFQNAFVPGRLMVDNCYVAHEILSRVKGKRKGGRFEGIMKIDLNKAYDKGSSHSEDELGGFEAGSGSSEEAGSFEAKSELYASVEEVFCAPHLSQKPQKRSAANVKTPTKSRKTVAHRSPRPPGSLEMSHPLIEKDA